MPLYPIPLYLSRMIKATGIFKSYNDLKVLQGIDISIETGEIVSIVGPSGAGKSTLLHIIGTLDKADAGSVEINAVKVGELNAKKLAAFRNKNIGFIFQFHHLLPEFTALENVCVPAFIGNTGKKEAEKKAQELLEYLGLKDRMYHKPKELSGGEQQRVAAARALINNPTVIMADEPSGNLDTKSATELHNLFFQLRKEFNQTFVIVTHNEELANMADRKLTMRDGNIVNTSAI
jgi:lipoprotein-releasing system ATP-binding protein